MLVGTLLLLVGAAACSSGDDEAVDLVKDLEVGLEHLYPEAVLVEMKNIQFVPDRIEVNAGEAAQVVLKNSDLSVHTFTIKELEIDHTILFDDEKLVELPALDSRRVHLYLHRAGSRVHEGDAGSG